MKDILSCITLILGMWIVSLGFTLYYNWFSYSIQLVPLLVGTVALCGCMTCFFFMGKTLGRDGGRWLAVIPLAILILAGAAATYEKWGGSLVLAAIFLMPFSMPVDYVAELLFSNVSTTLYKMILLIPWVLYGASFALGMVITRGNKKRSFWR